MILYLNFLVFALTLVHTYSFVNSEDFGPCLTPDSQEGKCVFLNRCLELAKLYSKDPWTKAEELFLKQSECTGVDEDEAVVCCGSENPVPESVRHPPKRDSLLPTSPECGVIDIGIQFRMIGGDITNILEYPWMALLLYTRQGEPTLHGCAGGLINKRYVLTAAHCLAPITKRRRKFQLTAVRLGEWDTSTIIDIDGDIQGDPVVEIRIEENIVHELYDHSIRSAYNDIGLLRLERVVEYTNFIKPICIHHTDDLLDKDMSRVEMFAAGWGYTENNTVSNKKLAVSLLGKNIEACQLKYRSAQVILQDTQMCAGGENTDTCSGDAGGPLVLLDTTTIPAHFHVVGVASFGPVPCGQRNFPGVNTKVVKFFDWIESKLRP